MQGNVCFGVPKPVGWLVKSVPGLKSFSVLLVKRRKLMSSKITKAARGRQKPTIQLPPLDGMEGEEKRVFNEETKGPKREIMSREEKKRIK